MRIKLLFLILFYSYLFSYLILLKLNMGLLVQEIRYLIVIVQVFLVCTILSLRLVKLKKYTYYFIFFIIMFYICSSVRYPQTLTSNLKIILYLLTFVLFRTMDLSSICVNKNLFNVISLSIILICFYQLNTNDWEYINGVYRLSGPYYKHSSGFALFLGVWIAFYFNSSKNWISVLFLICLFYFLIRTGSRSAFLASLLGFIVVYYNNFSLKLKIALLSSILIILIGFGEDIINSEIMFRFKYLIENGIDGSSAKRLDYIKEIISKDGYGVINLRGGYTPILMERIFGKRIGSHNNMLLFLVEGGFVLLLIYILHLVYILKNVFRIRNASLTFMFIAFYLGGILNNNYYYVLPMCLFVGYYAYQLNLQDENKNYSKIL